MSGRSWFRRAVGSKKHGFNLELWKDYTGQTMNCGKKVLNQHFIASKASLFSTSAKKMSHKILKPLVSDVQFR